MNEITVQELKELQDSHEDFVLIDVREPHEYEAANLGGESIPMSTLMNSLDMIPKDKKVVVHCRSGARSGAIIRELESNHGFSNLFNLKGGLIAWAEQVDPSIQL